MRFGVIMLFSLFSPIFVYAATISNAGFIPAPLWFSRDTFFAGETVRIYTVVYNGSDSDIRGTAEFLNGDIVIGTNDFSLARGGRSQDIWIDWKATEGDSRISARIVRARATVAGGKEESIDFSQSLTAEVSVSVDVDTDKDGVGNKVDPDDDNDGISDMEEIRAGTNPLVKDAPPKSDSNKDSVSYNTNSPADRVVAVATEKASDVGSTVLLFAESVREKGSVLLDKKTTEVRKEIEEIRAAQSAARTKIVTEIAGESTSITTTSRAKEIAEQNAPQNPFDRAIAYISSTFSKITDLIFTKDEKSDTSAETQVAKSEFSAIHTPFAYVKLVIYATLAFLFRHAIFFYLFLLGILYYIIRVLIRFVRNR